MSVFVLVPGLFTGADVWAEVARHLESSGAEVHTVRFSAGAGAGVTLETHVEEVVETIDRVGTRSDIVLVAHDYGAYPALGATDRRADRVRRLVHVDAPPPLDGTPALAVVPDQSLRARLARATPPHGDALAPPAAHEWQHWGSTRGIPAGGTERLTAMSAPHPVGTLTQPLRLTGAASAVPTTGVLCHYNGSTMEMLRMLVRFGTPALQPLLRPDVTFFELPTGHWPMLSCPDTLAEVLVRAAAGEGERLATPPDDGQPEAPRSFLIDAPPVPRERRSSPDLDLYVPGACDAGLQGPLPAVVFVHGGPVPKGIGPTPRDWPVITGYAHYAASRAVVAATLDHRLHDVTDYPTAAADLAEAVEAVRADPRVDADRIALWFLSGSGPITAEWLSSPPAWLRCLVAAYPIMSPLPNWGVPRGRFRPARALSADSARLPVVILRPEREQPVIAATVDEFLEAAATHGVAVDAIDVPGARHGFEGLDHTDAARDAVHRAMTQALRHLTGTGG
ncbi:alpha/beta fold hydrolase [Streptomyces beihaiensis]|uniref:Alpha/beta hydrolase n=1 Tax=Streptomyces beihaiensis TaxID=2984495 RepID=A0ABT3TX76_9ACTN|nr:alpha/beta fold hydrolase [Streptomyces beihaiensis]MCX3061655.1 alpha/beta hydrolase [Streptomyces beihaiensis]